MNKNLHPLSEKDFLLIDAAKDCITKNYLKNKVTVAAALHSHEGEIYTGTNIETCAYGPCAEPIAIGAAFNNQAREIKTIVAIYFNGEEYKVIPPCGNCRQLMYDYMPQCQAIIKHENNLYKITITDLLPFPYKGIHV